MTEQQRDAAFSLPARAAAERLAVDPRTGLSAAEARRRRARHGPNALRATATRSAWRILLAQLRSVIVWLLAAAMGLSLVVGDYAEAVAILVVLIINTAIGFFTELRAVRSMEALRQLAVVETRVRRDGRLQQLDSRDLVPGDIVVLEAGDVVTADLRLLGVSALAADESVLTGESAPVGKQVAPLPPDTGLADRVNMAFRGSAITRGAGEGVVVATGMETELGRISEMVQAAEPAASPIERRLSRLGQKLVWLTLGLAAMTVMAGVLRGRDVSGMIETGIALAVAAVPEGLPVVATLCLARGMWRMAERNALLSDLSSVETLGATTVILTDKTGTLTENRMTAERVLVHGGERAPDPAEDDPPLRWALTVGALCNTAELDGDPGAKGVGDPMELALLDAARRAGQTRPALLERFPEVKTHAFDPGRMMMATVHRAGEGYLHAVKGAPDRLMEVCDSVLAETGPEPFDAGARAFWDDKAEDLAGRGYRLLALAMKRTESPDAPPYEGLTLLGFACLLDPVRADVPEAIADCLRAGVRVVMMTGDHAATAAEIARQAGLADGRVTAVTGREIGDTDAVDGPERDRLLATDVFARVSPELKLDLATLYQESGEIVAMTGDGVNDAPALRKADIGIAMGKRGTDVAREAARMVLKDDAFPTIVVAMREGRIIFDNIRKFVLYLMSCNLSEVLVVGLAVGAGLPAPLLPLQILFLNLVTDVFPAFALGLGRGTPGVMDRPPRDPEEPIATARHWGLIAGLGLMITAATLGAYVWAHANPGLSGAQAITVAFLTLALAQLWNVLNLRDRGSGLFDNEVMRNPWVWAALALCLGIISTAFLVGPLADILQLPWPGRDGVIVAVGASLAPLVLWQVGLVLRQLIRRVESDAPAAVDNRPVP